MQPHKPRVLVDLLPALSGYAGIPQESRLLFRILSEKAENIKTGGFIYSNHINTLKYEFPRNASKKDDIIVSAGFFNDLVENAYPTKKYEKPGLLKKLEHYSQKIPELYRFAVKRAFTVKEIDTEHFYNFLWRTFFSKTLTVEDFNTLKQQQYFISTLNMKSMLAASILRGKAKLDTSGWDFAIFHIHCPAILSPGTTKIIRYHDSIPLQDMDVCVPGSRHGQLLNEACADGSFFVCNSGPTRDELIRIAPELEKRSAAIPPIVANYRKENNRETMFSIIKRSYSSALINDNDAARLFSGIQQDDFRYILILSTLEPRKNHLMLIRAWERLRSKHKIKQKLMIVGSPGWKYEAILDAMKPHVKDGSIIHLEKIHPDDMGYLYTHADAFVFPSFNEGFGSPPLEAMQCECPVIASDIAAHRWAYGDAALFCNPYDVTTLEDQLAKLLIAPESEGLRQDLIRKGLSRSQQYHADKVSVMWHDLIQSLHQKKRRSA